MSALIEAFRKRADTWEREEGEVGALVAGEIRVVLGELERELAAAKGDCVTDNGWNNPMAASQHLSRKLAAVTAQRDTLLAALQLLLTKLWHTDKEAVAAARAAIAATEAKP
jgi:hypothetical protein